MSEARVSQVGKTVVFIEAKLTDDEGTVRETHENNNCREARRRVHVRPAPRDHTAPEFAGFALTLRLLSGALQGMAIDWQGMLIVLSLLSMVLGNVVVLFPIALNSHAGTRYGIPFPVLARASFGVLGANVPALLRVVHHKQSSVIHLVRRRTRAPEILHHQHRFTQQHHMMRLDE